MCFQHLETVADRDQVQQVEVLKHGSEVKPGKTGIAILEQTAVVTFVRAPEAIDTVKRVSVRFGSALFVPAAVIGPTYWRLISTYRCQISRAFLLCCTGGSINEVFPTLTVQSSCARLGRESLPVKAASLR